MDCIGPVTDRPRACNHCPMSTPSSCLLMEHAAVIEAAIKMLECERSDNALKVLRLSLEQGKAPEKGADLRSASVVRLRAHIEKAILELEHGHSTHALGTLRSAIKSERR